MQIFNTLKSKLSKQGMVTAISIITVTVVIAAFTIFIITHPANAYSYNTTNKDETEVSNESVTTETTYTEAETDITEAETEEITILFESINAMYYATEVAIVYTYPSTSSASLYVLSEGEGILTTGKSDEWIKVTYNKTTGYVLASVVTSIDPTTTQATTKSLSEFTTAADTSEQVTRPVEEYDDAEVIEPTAATTVQTTTEEETTTAATTTTTTTVYETTVSETTASETTASETTTVSETTTATTTTQATTTTEEETTSSRYCIAGVDVSKWQGSINWASVAADNIEFAIIKIGGRDGLTGALYEDPKFEANIAGALANGLDVGVYFYSQATSAAEAKEEAEYCISLLSSLGYNASDLTYGISYDFELYTKSYRAYINYYTTLGGGTTAKNALTTYVTSFCDTVTASGYYTMLYSDRNHAYGIFDMATLIKKYPLWYARYSFDYISDSNTGAYVEDGEIKYYYHTNDWLVNYITENSYAASYGGKTYTFKYSYVMWQCSQASNVSGINAVVDLDIILLN